MFLPSFRWQEHKERDTMAKFCGKCGARLDEATGLCPNCDADKMQKDSTQSQPSEVPEQVQADKRASEKPLSGKDSKKKSKSERRAQKKAAKKEKRAQWSARKKVCRFFLKLIFVALLLAGFSVVITGILTYSDVIDIPIVEEVLERLGFFSKGISTLELYQHYTEINNQALKIEEKYADDGSVSKDQLPELLKELSALAEQYKRQGILESYNVEETSIFMKFKSGVGYLYIPTNKDIMSGDQTGYILTIEPYATSAEFLSQYILGGKSPDKAAEEIAASLPKLYIFDRAHNQDGFGIEDVGQLGNNKIIIWYGHGGYIQEYGSVLGTSVSIKDKTALSMYAEELKNGEVILGKDCFCLCPSYLDKHIADDTLKGSMVYLAACESGRDNRLADVFFRKGATLVVGNTRSVFTRYNLYMMYDFLTALTNTYDDGTYWTAEDALQYAKDENGEKDGEFMFYGAEVRLIYPNNESGYRLKPFDAVMPIPNYVSEERIPASAVEFNDHYYYVYDIDTVTDWNMAQEYCEAQGGYLATITNAEEDAFLYSYITDAGYSSVMFGLTDQEQTDDWRWVTGEEFSYQNWRSGEPNHQGGYEHYGMYYERNSDGTWNDGSGRGGPFLCEWGEYNVESNSQSNEIWLDELAIIDSDRYDGNMGDSFIGKIGTRNGRIDIEGNDYEHGLEAWIARWNYKNESSWAWCVYDLEEKYATLSGVIGILETSYNKTNFDTTLEIWGDNKLLYSYNLYPGMSNEMVSLNVEGVRKLKISVFDNKSVSGGTAFVLGNFKLCKDGQPMDNQLNVKDSLRYEMREEVIDFSTSDGIVVIKSHIQYPYFTDGSTCAQLLNKRYADFIKSYKERDDDYDAYYSDIVDSGETHLLPFYDDVTIEVTYNKNGYISLKEATSSFTGGAHAYGEEKTLTLRLVDGKIMGCLDFLEGEDNLCDQLLKKYYTESIGYYPQGYGVGADAPFVLTQEGLCIFYDGGDSLPATSFTIPYTQMGSCIISVNALLDTKLLTNQAEDSSLVELSDYLYDDTVINVASAVGDMQVGSTEKFAEYAEGDKLIIAILAGETEDYYNQITDIKNTGNMLVTLYGIKIGDSIATVRKALSLENAGFYDPDESKDKQGNRVLTFWQGDAACLTTTFSNDCLASYSYELRYTSY